ncbi:hypothetical protein [Mycolicibacterium komossense]|nr:hypothetical protein [Mycolicibacterium komossense]
MKRFTKNEKASAQHVTIYGPDNKPLKNVLGRSADHIVELPTKPPKPEDR